MTAPPQRGGRRKALASLESGLKCALNSTGTRLAIITKTGNFQDSTPSSGVMYRFLQASVGSAAETFNLEEGNFKYAGDLIFTSDDKFLLVSFSNAAFGSSPSICAYDWEFAIPIAWFVSPLNSNFRSLATPKEKSSKFTAVDEAGRIFNLKIEEA